MVCLTAPDNSNPDPGIVSLLSELFLHRLLNRNFTDFFCHLNCLEPNLSKKMRSHYTGLGIRKTRDFGLLCLESYCLKCYKSWERMDIHLFGSIFVGILFFTSYFFPSSCGNLWLYKRQGRRAVFSGRSHYLRHQEERRRLVWGGDEWSDGALPWELCWVHHALFWVRLRRAVSLPGTGRTSHTIPGPWHSPQWSEWRLQMIKTTYVLVFFSVYPPVLKQKSNLMWTNGSFCHLYYAELSGLR